MKYLSKTNPRQFKGKTVLLRVDLNIENTRDEASLFRLDAVIPTIEYLLKAGARVVLMSHRGRPQAAHRNKSFRDFSLGAFALILAKRLCHDIEFIAAYRVGAIRKTLKKTNTRAILLENLRFFAGEEKNDPAFAKALATLGDYYVNDAFAVSHRRNASVVAITKFLPSFVGLQLEKEIFNLNKIKEIAKKPFTLIVGGAKTSDKVGVLEYFSKRADWILLGGGPANTFFKAAGLPIGNSVYDPKILTLALRMLRNENVVLPADSREKGGKILDIGPYTAEKFSKIIKSSKMVLWSGPLGEFEKKQFSKGSEKIARAIISSKAISIVGGGETVTLLAKLKLLNKIKFVSTGGGAMLDYLAGKKLPGIEALK